MRFEYVLRKIHDAPLILDPFPHIEIDGLFSTTDFEAIVTSPEVALTPQRSDQQLFEQLFSSGYRIINFPGCILDKDRYIKWHRHKRVDRSLHQSSSRASA